MVSKLEHARIVLAAIEDDSTPSQLAKVLWDIIEHIEPTETIGFKNDNNSNNS